METPVFRMLLEEKPIKKNLTLIGVLPSEEEVNRVKKISQKNQDVSRFLRYFKAEPISWTFQTNVVIC